MGDSITSGSGVSNINDVYRKRPKKNTGTECVGYGIGETRVLRQPEPDEFDERENYYDRRLKMDDKADIIVVLGKTNDYGLGNAPFGRLGDCTPETFCGAVRFVAKSLIEKYLDALIVYTLQSAS